MTVPFAVLFVVSLFDVNFKRFIYYINMMLWSNPHSPPIDKIETYYIRMSRKSLSVALKPEIDDITGFNDS